MKGMSFGAWVVQEEKGRGTPSLLKELDLFEYSLVEKPANPSAGITAAKSLFGQLEMRKSLWDISSLFGIQAELDYLTRRLEELLGEYREYSPEDLEAARALIDEMESRLAAVKSLVTEEKIRWSRPPRTWKR